MKVSFREALSLTRDIEANPRTFVFTGKGYNYPAAEIFARHLCRVLSKELDVHEWPSATDPHKVTLFQTQSEGGLDEFLNASTGCTRVIPFQENLYTTKAQWGNLMGNCTVVEVTNPTDKTLKNDISFACSLMGISYDEEGTQAAADNNDGGGWSGILSCIEYAATNGEGLVGRTSVVSRKLSDEVTYMSYKDSFLFKLPKDTADLILRSDSYLEFTSRIVDDLSLYFAMLMQDSEKVSTRDLAAAFGQNEWFLRNRLLPRLRTMGPVRILNIVEKLTDMVGMIMKGESVDGQAQMASATLLLLS